MATMKCPRCLTEQPDGGAVCVRCKTIFAEYGHKEVETLAPEAPPPSAGTDTRKTLANTFTFVVIGAVGAWLFVPPSGKPLPKGAFEHPRCYFAMSPVLGWKEMLGGMGVGACGTAETILGKPKVIEAYKSEGASGASGEPATLSVIVAPQELPSLGKTVPPTIWTSYPVGLGDYYNLRTTVSDVVEVDRLKSARLVAQAKRLVGGVEQEFSIFIALIPGRERTYILRGVTEDPANLSRWQIFMDSFRVTQRPRNYSHGIKRLIEGQIEDKLVGLLIAAAVVFWRLMFKS